MLTTIYLSIFDVYRQNLFMAHTGATTSPSYFPDHPTVVTCVDVHVHNVYMYVCIYIFMYVCTYVCMY